MSKTAAKAEADTSESKSGGRSELENAVAQNDDIWIKRMLLFITIMLIALLGLD
jgi:hypothetical protein